MAEKPSQAPKTSKSTTPKVNSGKGGLKPTRDVNGRRVSGEHPYTYVEDSRTLPRITALLRRLTN